MRHTEVHTYIHECVYTHVYTHTQSWFCHALPYRKWNILDPAGLVELGRAVSRDPVRSEGRPTGHPGTHAERPGGPMATQHRDIKQGGPTSLRLGRLLPTGWRLAPQAVRQPASCRRGDRLCCGLSRAHQIPAPSLGHCRSPASGEGAQLCHSAAGMGPSVGQSGLPYGA